MCQGLIGPGVVEWCCQVKLAIQDHEQWTIKAELAGLTNGKVRIILYPGQLASAIISSNM